MMTKESETVSRSENPLQRRWNSLKRTLQENEKVRLGLSAGLKTVSGGALLATGSPLGFATLISNGANEVSDAVFAYGLRAWFAKKFGDDPQSLKRGRMVCALGTIATAVGFDGIETVHSILAPAYSDSLAVGVAFGAIAVNGAIAWINSFSAGSRGIGHDGWRMAAADLGGSVAAAAGATMALTHPWIDPWGSGAAFLLQAGAGVAALRDIKQGC